jgi:hypothetical protein
MTYIGLKLSERKIMKEVLRLCWMDVDCSSIIQGDTEIYNIMHEKLYFKEI